MRRARPGCSRGSFRRLASGRCYLKRRVEFSLHHVGKFVNRTSEGELPKTTRSYPYHTLPISDNQIIFDDDDWCCRTTALKGSAPCCYQVSFLLFMLRVAGNPLRGISGGVRERRDRRIFITAVNWTVLLTGSAEVRLSRNSPK